MGNSGADTEAAGPEPAAFIPALSLASKGGFEAGSAAGCVRRGEAPALVYSSVETVLSCGPIAQ